MYREMTYVSLPENVVNLRTSNNNKSTTTTTTTTTTISFNIKNCWQNRSKIAHDT